MTQEIDSGGGKHGPRLDDQLEQESRAETDSRIWDTPGRDGVIEEGETDPDRRDLRTLIGQFVSLTAFPATTEDLIHTATANDAPDQVLDRLNDLEPGTTFANTRELWAVLELGTEQRF